ncbi:Type II/IV secretion system protein [Candidatus Bilamarchaeum dharawalense]|uniref:Type II/IV secretion system protein n=1 Tax=Candidatus Bilamarchaeum dharawalense TaxID=2885759 RepID=A0A5E4LWU2_9ARCH|nr:Type II/IV secretion system protein [Candidatus Bilamarchaeum dharawalense]
MLGWRILGQGEYKLDIPELSDDEKRLILATEERIKEIARTNSVDDLEARKSMIESAMSYCVNKNCFYLNSNQTAYLNKIAFIHIYGFGFLEQLVNDNEIEEISIIGPNKPVYVYIRKIGWKSINACFETEQAIADMINKMARGLGRHITMQNPRLDAVLPNGSRLHASLAPISEGEITVRKFRQRPFSPKELSGDLVSIEGLALLSMIMQCDFSVILAGNTASGKTTTMNSLFSFIPSTERVIITEETPEINVPHKHQLRLVANKEMDVKLKDLVYDSLRMRPDRVIIGEVRNKEEIEALFDVLLAGQARGNYATFHAQSADETLTRLSSFGIRRADLTCIDCIVVQRRMLEYNHQKRENREIRRITDIAEVRGEVTHSLYHDGRLHLQESLLVEKICDHFKLGKKELEVELGKRKQLILNANSDYFEFFDHIQKALYGGE